MVQESSNKNIQQTTESEEMDENIPADDIEYITSAESFEAGNGTAEDPYQIATAEQLALLSELCSDEKYNEMFIYETKVGIELLFKENEISESKIYSSGRYADSKNDFHGV